MYLYLSIVTLRIYKISWFINHWFIKHSNKLVYIIS